MKAFQWINLIGILCIILGAQAVINGVTMFMLMGTTHWAAIQENGGPAHQPLWLTIAGYFSILVNLLYLVAGVLFLKKKAFSLHLMYTVLILSLISGIVPMLVIGFQNTNGFPWQLLNIFFLIGPMLDVLLLIGVYQISRYYYTDPYQQINFLGTGTLSQPTLKLLTIAGFLVFLIPFTLFVLWFYVSTMELSLFDKAAKFQGFLPSILQKRFASTYLSLFCSVITIVCSSIGLKLADKGWHRLNKVVMIISILLFMLNLFILM
jgi:hypothetical protein